MPRLRTLPTRLQSLPNRVLIAEAGSWRAGRTGSTARGYGYDWQKLRVKHLAKHPHCVYCLRDLGMTRMSPADVVLACAAREVAEPLGSIGDHTVAHEGRLDEKKPAPVERASSTARLERGIISRRFAGERQSRKYAVTVEAHLYDKSEFGAARRVDVEEAESIIRESHYSILSGAVQVA